MGNISDAEDCISSVFMKILAGLKTAKFENEQKFQAWICRIAANECLMKLRKEIKFEKLSEKDEYHTIYPDNILEDIEASYLLTLIQSLPLGYRTIFNMYAIEGYSHNEIAKQLGISVGTSKSQLSKARAELQTKLKGRLQ
jgi:RNA polymerase sigma-70 factor (ECF subfamily)